MLFPSLLLLLPFALFRECIRLMLMLALRWLYHYPPPSHGQCTLGLLTRASERASARTILGDGVER